MSVTLGLPSVKVPVLSMTMIFILEAFSKVAASFIRILCLAPMPVPTATTVGVANPSASGQAITTAEMANVSAVKIPAQKRRHPRTYRQRHQPAGRFVGDYLDGRFGILGGFHHLDDLRQNRLRADLDGFEFYHAGLIDRSAYNFVSRFFGQRD